MNDKAIGIAVLQDHWLWVVCATHATSQCHVSRIDAYPVGSVELTKVAAPRWGYREISDKLLITPSLHVRCQFDLPDQKWTTIFHNAFDWSVQFVRIAENEDGHAKCLELNHEIVDKWKAGERNL